jgi:nicotinic acid phosphoribosyltransferase
MSNDALFTDLYELTMQAYHAERIGELAVFEVSFREMPPNRNYLVAVGFADVIDFLVNLQFQAVDLEYLRTQREFSSGFLEYLKSLVFRQFENGQMVGDVIGLYVEPLPGPPLPQPLRSNRNAQRVSLEESRQRLLEI